MQEVVEAKYDYKSDDQSHLCFSAGSRILILEKNSNGWWFGSLKGQMGWLPSNYIIHKESNQLSKQTELNHSDNIARQITDAAENLLLTLDSADYKSISDKARLLWHSIRKMPQQKLVRKVEKRLSSAVVNPSKTFKLWIDDLEEISYMCLDVIEKSDVLDLARPSTDASICSRQMVTPISPEIQKSLILNSRGKVKSGSRKALLEFLTSLENSDKLYQRIFLTTYPQYLTSKELLDHFQDALLARSSSESNHKAVINVIKIWIEDYLPYLNDSESFFCSVYKVLQTQVSSHSLDDSDECIKLLKRAKMFQKFRFQTKRSVFDSFLHRLYSYDLLQCNPDIVGEELHEMYLILFNQFQYSDWLACGSSTPKAVANITRFSTSVTKWVHSLIFKEADRSKRVEKLQMLIKVSRYLYEIRNFQGVRDILHEFQCDSLHEELLHIGTEMAETLKILLYIFCNDNSHMEYFEELKTVEGPFIPLFAAHLNSIKKIHSQFSNFASAGNVNFSKMALLSYTIEKILVSQRDQIIEASKKLKR